MEEKDKNAFSTVFTIDPETGWQVVYLQYQDANPALSKTAGIIPSAGSNLFSLKLGQDELLWQASSIREVQQRKHGTPVLYPTPNRVRSSQFTFGGETFKFTPNWKEHFLHGLVHGAVWQLGDHGADQNGARATTFMDFDPSHELFRLWPFRHRITLGFVLDRDGVKIQFSIKNNDTRPIPYGFALHPFFNYLGKKEETFIVVPAKHHMEAIGLLPTGKLEPMHVQAHDMRRPTALGQLYQDDVYCGMEQEKPAWYEIRDKGIKLTLWASPELTHMVVYTENPDFFCLENQSCSTDAHNLYARGLREEAHLLIVEPGQQQSMWIKFVMERT